MKQTLLFITGSQYKFKIAQAALQSLNINLIQEALDTPEIQSNDVKEIAKFSAKWASQKLNKPLFLTDSGAKFLGLNNFPGPFVKYINQWFSAEDYLNLLRDKEDRRIVCTDCLAYCEPNQEPIIFYSETPGHAASKASKTKDSPFMQIFIPEGYNKPASDLPEEEMIQFWKKHNPNYQNLIKHLKS